MMTPRYGTKPLSAFLLIAAACAFLGLRAESALAAGTPAGTAITNQATANYSIGANSYTTASNAKTIRVDDKVSFTLTPGDTANVTLVPGGRAYQTYFLTNTGNGPHDFTLSPAAAGTPSFSPAAGPAFYSDAAGTTLLPVDANAGGLPYLHSLASDATRTVYLYITAPAQAGDGQALDYVVIAEAYQSNNLGMVNPPAKASAKAAADAAVDKNANLLVQYVVLADGHGNGGDSDRDGKVAVLATDGSGITVGFKVHSAAVNVSKAVTIADQNGGSLPVPGATLHYTLTVTATGSGTASGVLVVDPVPANTTYTPGTLKLNGNVLTDQADADAGDVGGTTPGTVTVRLGSMTNASPAQTVTFDVKIN